MLSIGSMYNRVSGEAIIPANGRFASNIPKAIGINNKGSNPFAIAR